MFQDESSSTYYQGTDIDSPTTLYYDDIAAFRSRLATFPENYYRGVVFQVISDVPSFGDFKQFILNIKDGIGANFSGVNGLSDRFDVVDTEANEYQALSEAGKEVVQKYYLDLIVEALIELGYEL